MPYVEFAQVNDIEVLLYPGTVSIEPELFIKDGDKVVSITLSSGIYENLYEEFFLAEFLPEKYKKMAKVVVDELATEVTKVGEFTQFTLKPEYKEKLMKAIDEKDKMDGYGFN